MVSERRRARMQAVEGQSEGVPDWIYGFPLNKWVSARTAAGEPVDFAVFVSERDDWHRRRDAWLLEHDVSSEEYDRMLRAHWAQLARRLDPPAA